jgi:hypothetical protein
VSGHTVYDTKQRPVRQFEPYFSPVFEFEDDEVLRAIGASTLTQFDAIGRAVSVHYPNGTSTRTTYRPWVVEHADANDTVLDSAYRALRESRPADDPERQALEHAKAHAGTSTLSFLDPLGRAVGGLARGGDGDDLRTELRLDVRGDALAAVDPRGLVAFEYTQWSSGTVPSPPRTWVDIGRSARSKARSISNPRSFHA